MIHHFLFSLFPNGLQGFFFSFLSFLFFKGNFYKIFFMQLFFPFRTCQFVLKYIKINTLKFMIKRTPPIIKEVKCDGVELNPTYSPTLVYYNHFITKVYSPPPFFWYYSRSRSVSHKQVHKTAEILPCSFHMPFLGLI